MTWSEVKRKPLSSPFAKPLLSEMQSHTTFTILSSNTLVIFSNFFSPNQLVWHRIQPDMVRSDGYLSGALSLAVPCVKINWFCSLVFFALYDPGHHIWEAPSRVISSHLHVTLPGKLGMRVFEPLTVTHNDNEGGLFCALIGSSSGLPQKKCVLCSM